MAHIFELFQAVAEGAAYIQSGKAFDKKKSSFKGLQFPMCNDEENNEIHIHINRDYENEEYKPTEYTEAEKEEFEQFMNQEFETSQPNITNNITININVNNINELKELIGGENL